MQGLFFILLMIWYLFTKLALWHHPHISTARYDPPLHTMAKLFLIAFTLLQLLSSVNRDSLKGYYLKNRMVEALLLDRDAVFHTEKKNWVQSKLPIKGLTAHLFGFPKCMRPSNPNPKSARLWNESISKTFIPYFLWNFFIFKMKKYTVIEVTTIKYL